MIYQNARFVVHFGALPDPRRDNGQLQHQFLDILVIALCALLSGADSFIAMEEYGYAKRAWLQTHLGLSLAAGIPSHDTFGRLFARLDPQAFERCLRAWTQELQIQTGGQVVALDGKTLRHSFDRASGQAALHLVSAWACANRLVLAQQAVAEHSNEITALPVLLRMLDVRGCLVSVDALNTQKTLAAQIREQGGDYLLALKENHPSLHAEVADYFAWATATPQRQQRALTSQARECHKGHGRLEVRRCWCVAATPQDWPQARQEWPGLHSLVCVESQVKQLAATGSGGMAGTEATVSRRYYLSSAPPDAARLLGAVRSHWGIENSAHWVLDVALAEDACRVRTEHAPRNLATLRRLGLNLLRQDTQHPRGIQTRRHRVAWDDDYLLRILCGT